jgi:sensor histidine kinase YesM
LDDEDIVTILSNLLDNAVEACKKCDSGKRIIKLKLVNEAVEKYNGSCVIRNDGEEFYFSLVIPA